MKKKLIFLLVIFLFATLLSACKDKDFANAVKSLKSMDDNRLSSISDGEYLLSTIDEKEFVYKSVLDNLRAEIESAKAFEIKIPKQASNSDKVKKQTQDLLDQKKELKKLCKALDSAIDSVTYEKYKAEEEEVAKQQAKVSPQNVYTYYSQTNDGYDIEATLNIGDWIKASDKEMLSEAWAAVGGQGDAPDAESFRESSNDMFRNDHSAIVFGYVTFKNTTQGFDITPEYPLETKVWIDLQYDNYWDSAPGLYAWNLLVGYSDGNMLMRKSRTSSQSLDIGAKMEGNQWGPAPIALAVANVFNPNNPNGNPDLDNVRFYLGTTEFTVAPSWKDK